MFLAALGLFFGLLFSLPSAARAATLTLSQDPVTDCANGLGRATLRWSGANEPVEVRIGGPAGPAMTGLTSSPGESTTGYWISDGMRFVLVNARGAIEARAEARLRCGGNVSALELAARNGSFLPLQVGNTWVYKNRGRALSYEYVTYTISGTETLGGLTYFVLTSGGSGGERLRADAEGRIWRFTGTAETPKEELLLDASSPQSVHAPFAGPLGTFDDTVRVGFPWGLGSESRVYARGIGMVWSETVQNTGSSGGVLDNKELVEARLAGLAIAPTFPRLSLAVENKELDVSGRKVTNCRIIFGCIGFCPVDPPEAYRPCAQARVEAGAAGEFTVEVELADASGRVVFRQPASGTGDLLRHVQLQLYSGNFPGPYLPFAAGEYSLTARLKSGTSVLATESITVRIN